ncbi:MAG TPA: glycosyltransferase family 9 protein [Casimicrobiaceae bacterium]
MAIDRGARSPLRGCRSLAVFRALQLGDLLCAVPALRALRHSVPGARITLVGLPWASAFAARFHRYVDDFVAFPGAPELPEQAPDVARLPAFFADMRARRFDLALQMHGSGIQTNAIVARFGARNSAGFYAGDEPAPDAQHFLPYPFELHEIRRNLRLVEFLGATATGDDLEFPLSRNDRDELAAVRDARSLSAGRYACLHAGARNPAKRWPVERFAQVGDALHDRGLEIVLTGSGVERPIAEAIARAMRAPSRNLALPISIGAMAALIADARLIVTNDTGVSHVATGLHVPSVVVFFATDPAQWAPLDTRLHRTVYRPDDVDVATVLNAALELLDDTDVSAAQRLRPSPAPMRGATPRRA